MKSWEQMDLDLDTRIAAAVPEFVTRGYAESLDDERKMKCRVPACFRLWEFPESEGSIRAQRVVPNLRKQILPVRLTLGLIFDSKRSIAGVETARGPLGSLQVVPRTIQAVVTWKSSHFRAPFEFVSAETGREGTRTFWDVVFRSSIDEPFV